MAITNPNQQQTQMIIEAAKKATHFRPTKLAKWLRIVKVAENEESPYIVVEAPNGLQVHAIKDMAYFAIAFENRAAVTLPQSHVLTPMVESLRFQLDKYTQMMSSGEDNPAEYKEAFGGLHNHFLYEVGITNAMIAIKKHEWLIAAGCAPIVACMVVHLEDLSRAAMHYDNGGRTGLHASVIELEYWEYLFHSIEILVAELQTVIDNHSNDQA